MPITPSADPLFIGQVRPSDVPPYVPKTIAWATGTNPSVIGDGTATGGFAPYWTEQPADIPTPDRAGWIGEGYADISDELCIGFGGDKIEAKFRTHGEFTPVLAVDSIRYHLLAGGSHLHMHWGNRTPSAAQTRATARTLIGDDDGSGAAGGRLNSTGYWMPALLFDKDGVTYAITPGWTIIYYTENPWDAEHIHPNVNGMRYVSGADMEYPTRMLDVLADANAGAPGRYQFNAEATSPFPMYHKWSIEGSPGSANGQYLVNPDGSNPFEGVGTVAEGGTALQLEFRQPLCWDGVNPWSPRGYDHVMPMLVDTIGGGAGVLVPPLGWYRLPTPSYNMAWDLAQLEAFLGGPFYDFNPRLSSDAHFNMLGYPGKGHSVHADWQDGWDEESRRAWETNGIGCELLGGIPHQLEDSRISEDEGLLRAQFPAPDGKHLQVDFDRPIQITRIPSTRTQVTVAAMNKHNKRGIFEGDSLSVAGGGWGGLFATEHPELDIIYRGGDNGEDVNNIDNPGAVGSSNIQHVLNRLPALLAAKPKWVHLNIGANGFITGHMAKLAEYYTALHEVGIQLIVSTTLPLSDAVGGPGFEVARQANNAALKAGIGTYADCVIDIGGHPVIGTAEAGNDTDLFGDGQHPSAAVYAIATPIVHSGIEAFLGLSAP